jgi:flavin-binding protein dodecin
MVNIMGSGDPSLQARASRGVNRAAATTAAINL